MRFQILPVKGLLNSGISKDCYNRYVEVLHAEHEVDSTNARPLAINSLVADDNCSRFARILNL
jgi:hypothetical protein